MKTLHSILVAIFAVFLSSAAAPAQMMQSPVPMTLRAYQGTAPGGEVQLMVRVQSHQRSEVRAEILDRVNDGLYKGTGVNVTLYFADGTPVVMGATSDVAAGAVLFVYGIATKKDQADVKKLIVLTKYVKAE